MLKRIRCCLYFALVCSLLLAANGLRAQTGNSGSIEGVVKDPSGATIAGATVEILNPVSGYTRTATTGVDGAFRFSNVPFNPYHLTVSAPGFGTFTQDLEVRSGVPTVTQIALKVGSASTSVTVESNGGYLV
jgi:hypothetical protein